MGRVIVVRRVKRISGNTGEVDDELVVANYAFSGRHLPMDSDSSSLLPIGLPTSLGPSDRRWPGA